MLLTLQAGIYLHATRKQGSVASWTSWTGTILQHLGFTLPPTLDKFKAAIHSHPQDLELQNTMGSFSSVQEDTDKYRDGFRWVK